MKKQQSTQIRKINRKFLFYKPALVPVTLESDKFLSKHSLEPPHHLTGEMFRFLYQKKNIFDYLYSKVYVVCITSNSDSQKSVNLWKILAGNNRFHMMPSNLFTFTVWRALSVNIKGKVKVNFTLEQVTKAQMGSRGTALNFSLHYSYKMWVANAKSRPLYLWARYGTQFIDGCVGPRSCLDECGKFRPH